PEAAARAARYELLGAALAPGEALLTAHHEDDQLETVLLQLLRGAGLAGIAAMPARAAFARGALVRPLLPWSRAELTAWVRSQGLEWIEDPGNAELRRDRNYLRTRVLPLIRSAGPRPRPPWRARRAMPRKRSGCSMPWAPPMSRARALGPCCRRSGCAHCRPNGAAMRCGSGSAPRGTARPRRAGSRKLPVRCCRRAPMHTPW